MKFVCSIPMLFTIARIVLTPLVALAIMQNNWLVAFGLFGSAAFTDFLDGYYARLLHQETVAGALLDPVADKILLLTTFFVLTFNKKIIPWWFFAFVCLKELIIVVGALVMGIRGKVTLVKPSMLGKISTCVQIFFLVVLLFFQINDLYASLVYSLLFVIMASLILLSLIHYVFIGIRLLL